MKDNLVLAVFKVESEAHQAFNELTQTPAGEGFTVSDAALIKKNAAGELETLQVFGEAPDNNSAAGAVIGGLIGLLGGPVGVLLGAAIGGLAGAAKDVDNVVDAASVVAVVASKIYGDEVAVAAIVKEEEPAFDAAFAKFDATIIRYDAEAIAAEAKQLKADELEKLAQEDVKEEEKPAEQPKKELTGWRSATNAALEA